MSALAACVCGFWYLHINTETDANLYYVNNDPSPEHRDTKIPFADRIPDTVRARHNLYF
ncbi:hypothetical protein AWB79_01043 [Caballeronia hypogeia]|uniref:Uncharacterized protein n=1 Tax=Caballeronia hypogeia TaxID=1777140 RepID=A0A157ZJV5_9BURK|nr:hypothetical protein [Caballeronia hypogeia]SAK45808.1 hypothetical protein AWB79_01043 [Caballeronia hypogeia]